MGALYNPETATWPMIASHLGRCLGNTAWKVSACLPVYQLTVTKLQAKEGERLTKTDKGLKVVASDNLCNLTFEPCTVYLIDVDRNCDDDHHEKGLHSNVLVCDSTRILHRFEPYYAQTVPQTITLQKALDMFLLDFFHKQNLVYKPMLEDDVIKTCPFGPQVLDSSASERNDSEHYCLVWCCAFVCYLVATGCNKDQVQTGLAGWLTGLAKSLGLEIPKTETQALAVSKSYLERIRQYGRDIVHKSKPGWPDRKRKRSGYTLIYI